MSSWQSFFNQLSRPQRVDSNSTSEIICQCNKGTLMKKVNTEFVFIGNCVSTCFCAIIETDKQKARKFSNNISISKSELQNTDKNIITGVNLLDQFMNKKSNLLD